MTDVVAEAVIAAVDELCSLAATAWSLSFGARPSAVQVGQVWTKNGGTASGLYVVHGAALSPATGWPMKRLSDGVITQMRDASRASGMWTRAASWDTWHANPPVLRGR